MSGENSKQQKVDPKKPGGGLDKKKEDDNKPDVMAALSKTMEGIGGTLGKLDQRLTGLEAAIQQSSQAKEPAKKDDDDDLDPKKIDTLTNSDFLGVIEKRVGKLLGGLDKKIDDTSTATTRQEIQQAVKGASEKFPDFWEFKDEMAVLVKGNPFLTPAQAYHLAKSENPEKAEEVAKKMKAKNKDDDDDEDSKDSFGGLMPTSGKTNRGKTKMNAKDAAEAAWDEVMGGFNIH